MNGCVKIKPEDIEARILSVMEVREDYSPHFEIDLPDKVISKLGLLESDTIKFIEENNRIYLEKA